MQELQSRSTTPRRTKTKTKMTMKSEGSRRDDGLSVEELKLDGICFWGTRKEESKLFP